MNQKENIDMLNWHESEQQQRRAIEAFKIAHINGENIGIIFQELLTRGKKSHWENIVTIIKEIGYTENKEYLPILFELLQDLNFPGAKDALEYLASLKKVDLALLVDSTLSQASHDMDWIWVAWILRLVDESNTHSYLTDVSKSILLKAEF